VHASYNDRLARGEPNAIKIWARTTTTCSGLTINNLTITTPGGDVKLEGAVAMQFGSQPAPRGSSPSSTSSPPTSPGKTPSGPAKAFRPRRVRSRL